MVLALFVVLLRIPPKLGDVWWVYGLGWRIGADGLPRSGVWVSIIDEVCLGGEYGYG
jgi:hypothetical protein